MQRYHAGIRHSERRLWHSGQPLYIRAGEVPEKCSEDGATASALPSSEDFIRGIWVSAGREELARRIGREECALQEGRRARARVQGPCRSWSLRNGWKHSA